MTPEAQRIAIAETCGWKPDDDGDGTGWKGSRIHQRLIGKKPTFRDGKVVSYLLEQTVPDYLNDLNAMHEAENVLVWRVAEKGCWSEYCDYLSDVCGLDAFGATATQRAEAFLRTIGKWEAESK